MRMLRYTLFPEAYGSNGHFIDKFGTVGELVVDTGMLINLPFDKVMPKIDELNSMFMEGGHGRDGEWEPFKLDNKEYDGLVEYLIVLPLNKRYRLEY